MVPSSHATLLHQDWDKKKLLLWAVITCHNVIVICFDSAEQWRCCKDLVRWSTTRGLEKSAGQWSLEGCFGASCKSSSGKGAWRLYKERRGKLPCCSVHVSLASKTLQACQSVLWRKHVLHTILLSPSNSTDSQDISCSKFIAGKPSPRHLPFLVAKWVSNNCMSVKSERLDILRLCLIALAAWRIIEVNPSNSLLISSSCIYRMKSVLPEQLWEHWSWLRCMT